jgi:vacuolar-type H+-ATPase subunit I/STV1
MSVICSDRKLEMDRKEALEHENTKPEKQDLGSTASNFREGTRKKAERIEELQEELKRAQRERQCSELFRHTSQLKERGKIEETNCIQKNK